MDHRKARKVAKVLALVLVMTLIITSLSFIMFIPGIAEAGGYVAYGAESKNTGNSTESDLQNQMDTLEKLIKTVRENYKDDISYQTLIDGAFTGVFDALGDPYSVYYATVEEGDEFVDSASGQYSGIGVSVESYNGACRVVAPISGGPAEAAGIRTGDIITKVDGVSLDGKTLAEASSLMKGAAGTTVTLTISRGGETLTMTLTREKIKETTVNSSMLDNQIGYIQITRFGARTHLEFKAAKLKLLNSGAESLIIDVRSNPGGVMGAAAGIADQLIPEGPIFHYAQKGKVVETVTATGVVGKTVPIVLLVNEGSASATEALAGALQDSDAAVLVGTTTYGKGVAQQVAELPNGASFKLSMYYFLTPDEHQIDHVGITPDYTVYNGLGLSDQQIAEIYGALAPMTEKVKYKAGETGLNVYAAQQRLELLGYDVIPNGTMDEKTVTAVKQFQKARGFSAYGGLDFTTMNALTRALAEYVSGGDGDAQMDKAVELLSK